MSVTAAGIAGMEKMRLTVPEVSGVYLDIVCVCNDKLSMECGIHGIKITSLELDTLPQ